VSLAIGASVELGIVLLTPRGGLRSGPVGSALETSMKISTRVYILRDDADGRYVASHRRDVLDDIFAQQYDEPIKVPHTYVSEASIDIPDKTIFRQRRKSHYDRRKRTLTA
jgi:hypothetical protein